MADRTAASRNARLRERKREAGIIPLTVMVPADRAEDLKAIAAKMRDEVTCDPDIGPLIPLRMTGRCASGAERDGGAIFHAVPEAEHYRWGKAVCGAKPGSRGNGWGEYSGDAVTCTRCLKKLNHSV